MDEDEQRAIALVAQRLSEKFPSVGSIRVEDVVNQQYHSLDGAPIRSFVSILVEKEATEALEKIPA